MHAGADAPADDGYMPNFEYTAIDSLGRRIEGAAIAPSEDALAETLLTQGRHLVRATEQEAPSADLAQIRVLERVTRRDVIFFTSQLATVMATGVHLLDGLAGIEEQTDKHALKRVIAAVRRDVASGMSMSAAFARHPKVFSELYVSVVQAGEATGKAEQALEDLVRHLEWQEDLNARLREISTYPLIVISLLSVLLIVLVTFTIPRFMLVYERLGLQIELPWPTKTVMAVANVIRGYWYLLAAGAIGGVVALRLWRGTTAGRIALDRLALRLPIAGELIRKIVLSRFAHYLGMLHENGFEVAPSLRLIERVLGNAYLSQQFSKAVDRVLAGEALSRALKAVDGFPPLVIQMVSLGERTGQMAKALGDVRRYFDKEIDRTVRRTMTLAGPILLFVLAGVFVLMALAFYLPLFQLLGAIR